jgi:type IV secretory pathway VirB2 component (pilin)
VVGLIGVFLVQAAWQAQPSEAQGLGSTLQEIVQQPAGPWLLAIVAIGLIAYGIFMAFMGRYRKLNVS